MKLIPLGRGYFTQVDDWEFERLSAYKWHTQISPKRKAIYAVTSRSRFDGKQVSILMHTLVLRREGHIDHKDGDGLNNQKSNLRVANRSQNGANQGKDRREHSSVYKGVYWRKDNGVWKAGITVNQKKIHIGMFKEECDAALAYNLVAEKLFGEFAYSNTPIMRETV